MDGMLVMIFDTEAKAIEARNALLQLDDQGSISVYAHAIVAKNADGTTKLQKEGDSGLLGTVAGLELGSFIGLLSGPGALPISAGLGLLAGGASDLHNARITDEFIRDVTRELRPNRFAVIAAVQENSTTFVDDRMKTLGGAVFRRALSELRRTLLQEHIAAMTADLAEMKTELGQSHAARKAKFQEEINRLKSKLRQPLHKPKEPRGPEERTKKANAEPLNEHIPTLKEKAS
jgi:uncharacterized membrane protein